MTSLAGCGDFPGGALQIASIRRAPSSGWAAHVQGQCQLFCASVSACAGSSGANDLWVAALISQHRRHHGLAVLGLVKIVLKLGAPHSHRDHDQVRVFHQACLNRAIHLRENDRARRSSSATGQTSKRDKSQENPCHGVPLLEVVFRHYRNALQLHSQAATVRHSAPVRSLVAAQHAVATETSHADAVRLPVHESVPTACLRLLTRMLSRVRSARIGSLALTFPPSGTVEGPSRAAVPTCVGASPDGLAPLFLGCADAV